MHLNINGLIITVSFDPYGSLYIDHNQKTYQVNITGTGLPSLEEGTYQIIKPYIKEFKKIIPIDKTNPLQKKLKKKIEKHDNEDDNNSDEEYFLEDENDNNYYPEDQDHVNEEENNSDDDISIDGDTIEKYGEYNHKFDFWNNGDINIYNREDGDITAIYDTYIYDSNKLIFKSHSMDDSSIYRFVIHNNGDILFRPIGGIERKCKLIFANNELILLTV